LSPPHIAFVVAHSFDRRVILARPRAVRRLRRLSGLPGLSIRLAERLGNQASSSSFHVSKRIAVIASRVIGVHRYCSGIVGGGDIVPRSFVAVAGIGSRSAVRLRKQAIIRSVSDPAKAFVASVNKALAAFVVGSESSRNFSVVDQGSRFGRRWRCRTRAPEAVT